MKSGHLLRTALLGAALGVAAFGAAQAAEPPLKVGLLEDVSGDLAFMGMPKLHGSQLAVEEINKTRRHSRPADRADPSRSAGRQRPLPGVRAAPAQPRQGRRADRRHHLGLARGRSGRSSTAPTTPYFYTNQYEGGVCDASMISMGAVPEQQFSTLIPWMIEKFGKKVYSIAADYNFGQISAEWNRKIIKEHGGEVVGEEFIPLGVSQFAQTIQNIQKAKPDWILTINVGAAQDSFFEQAAAAKLNLPMGSSIKVMLGLRAQALQAAGAQQHARDRELVRGDRHARSQRLQEALAAPSSRTSPTSTTWATTPTTRSTCTRRWSRRRSRPSSSDMRKVIATGDACIDAPEGQVCIDPKSQHTSHRMRLISVGPRARGQGREGLRHDQAVLARRDRLRPDQEERQGPVHAEPSAEEVVTRYGHGSCSCIVPVRV